MSQKTAIEALEVHLDDILGGYLKLGEVVNDFQQIKNRKNLSTGKYLFNRDLNRKVDSFQQQLSKLSCQSMQLEKKLVELQTP
jgi:hypothetical protein|tara:strand:- start:48 stop:296 length:249 start_codon:yes stop_codon:yes gene_type:complete